MWDQNISMRERFILKSKFFESASFSWSSLSSSCLFEKFSFFWRSKIVQRPNNKSLNKDLCVYYSVEYHCVTCPSPLILLAFASLRFAISSSSGLIFFWSSIICAAKSKTATFNVHVSVWWFSMLPKLRRTLTQVSDPHVTGLQHLRLWSYLTSDSLQFILQSFHRDKVNVLSSSIRKLGVKAKTYKKDSFDL